jgi:putative membrane protein
MKHSLLFAISLAALTLSSCGKKPETPAAEGTEAAGDASEAAVAAAGPAQSFANAAAASDTFEIQTSKLAADKAGSAKVKSFAQEMIKAHTASTAKLMTAAASATLTPDPTMTPEQQKTLSDLQGKTGADFDTAYARAQVEAHQMTLDTLKSYAANGDSAPLKGFANEITPTVAHHLDMAKAL